MGAMDAVYDSFARYYPITLKVYKDFGDEYTYDKAKKKEEEGGVFYKLFNSKNYVPYCDISSGRVYHKGKVEYEVYMPTGKEIIPMDRKKTTLKNQVMEIKKSLEASDLESIKKQVAELEKIADKPVFIDTIVPAGVRMGLAQQVRLEVNYFGKSWLEKYGNIILTCVFVAGTVAIVWLSYDTAQSMAVKVAQQMPQVISAYVNAAAQVPKV